MPWLEKNTLSASNHHVISFRVISHRNASRVLSLFLTHPSLAISSIHALDLPQKFPDSSNLHILSLFASNGDDQPINHTVDFRLVTSGTNTNNSFQFLLQFNASTFRLTGLIRQDGIVGFIAGYTCSDES